MKTAAPVLLARPASEQRLLLCEFWTPIEDGLSNEPAVSVHDISDSPTLLEGTASAESSWGLSLFRHLPAVTSSLFFRGPSPARNQKAASEEQQLSVMSPVENRKERVPSTSSHRSVQSSAKSPCTVAWHQAHCPASWQHRLPVTVLQQQDACWEFLDSESAFLDDLQFLMRELNQFHAESSDIRSPQECLNLQAVLRLHVQWMGRCLQCVHQWTSKEFLQSSLIHHHGCHAVDIQENHDRQDDRNMLVVPVILALGQAMLPMIDYFKIYIHYCANYPQALWALQSPEYRGFRQRWAKEDHIRGLDAAGFLMKPIQRLCKYPLLFKEMVRFTPNSDPDYSALKECQRRFERVVALVNEGAQRAENAYRLVEIAQAFHGEFLNIVEPSRRLIRTGKVQVLLYDSLDADRTLSDDNVPASLTDAELFLFNDCIVLGKICSSISRNRQSTYRKLSDSINSASINRVPGDTHYEHVFSYPLVSLILLPQKPPTADGLFYFEILCDGTKKWTFHVASPRELLEWQNTITRYSLDCRRQIDIVESVSNPTAYRNSSVSVRKNSLVDSFSSEFPLGKIVKKSGTLNTISTGGIGLSPMHPLKPAPPQLQSKSIQVQIRSSQVSSMNCDTAAHADHMSTSMKRLVDYFDGNRIELR